MPLQPGGHARAFAEDAINVNVVASATPHAKGAWTQLIASTSADHGWACLANAIVVTAAADNSTAVDLAIGASGSERVLVEGIIIGGTSGGMARQFPIRIPAGSRVSARVQSANASRGVGITLGLSSLPKFLDTPERATTYGFNAAASTGVVIPTAAATNVKGAWTELVASTTNPIRWALPVIAAPNNATMAAANAWVDFGYGPAGSEVPFVSGARYDTFTSEECRGLAPTVPAYLPAGVRLAVRSRNSTTTAGSQPACVLIGLD